MRSSKGVGPLSALVLAAGEGTRMRSTQPKPLHLLCGRPMVLHVLDALAELPVERVVVVVGHGAEGVIKAVQEGAPGAFALEFVEQHVQRGTGDAAAVGLTGFPDNPDDEQEDGDVVVLPGDAPLLRPPTLAALVRTHRASDAAAGLHDAGYQISSLVVADPMEAAGVNDRAQLAVAEAELRDRTNERWMRRGVTMHDPERTYVDASVELAPDVTLLPGTVLEG